MKNLFKATMIVLGFASILSCKEDEVVNKAALNENMTEIEMLESTSGKRAFKKTVDVVSADGLQTYTVQIGSFDEQSFELATKNTVLKLVHVDKNIELKAGSVGTSQLENDEQTDLSKMVFQIVGVKNLETAHLYWLQLGFERKAARNLRTNGDIHFEVVSHNWPSKAIIGRDPGSVGSVNFNYGQKRRWWNSWDTWGVSPYPLFSPDLRNFFPDDQWRARFTGDYDAGATWLYNFF